jgi:hypothetical protein
MTEDRLSRIGATLAEMRGEIAALTATMSSVARNVEIAAVGRSLARVNTEIATMREDMTVQTASIVRLDNTVNGMRGELRAVIGVVSRAADRLRAVETRVDAIEDGAPG